MSSIDERIVTATFDNAKFEANAAKTIATLAALSKSLKDIGSTSGLSDLERSANRINFSGLASNLDKIKQRLNFGSDASKGFTDLQGSVDKVHFGPLSSALDSIKGKLSTFLTNPSAALDSFKLKLSFPGAEKSFGNLETASRDVKFTGAHAAVNSLKDNLQFKDAGKGFDNIEKASSRVKLSAISSAVASVGSQFSVLSGAAAVALGSIAAKGIAAGGAFVKSFSFGPVVDGLQEYTTNLNSIQTILANTKFQGSNLQDVNKALKELNAYSDQTIYNFSEMAKNIGTFTAAGVDLKTSTQSIKGIANLAALSGSNSQQASTAMYQLSQAIASGRVSLQDWNSVVTAGMGGATFQRALAQTAVSMGTIADGALKVDKATGKASINGQTFRDSIMAKPGEQSWLTSEVLTSTLKQFTGDLSDAELAAMGFNSAQIKSIQETAKTAKLAATEVKTLKGVFDVAKENIGSGWAETFQIIFGDFNEAKTLFTGFSQFLGGFIEDSADARNSVLNDWKELGGRTMLIEGIKDVFTGLGSVIKPIKDAFRDIFPAKTGKDLFEMTKRFADFAKSLSISDETSEKLKRTFAGFFAVLDIGKIVAGEILGVLGDLFGAAGDGSGGFLNLTGSVGDFLVSVRNAIKEGKGLSNFFDGLGNILSIPINLLRDFSGVLSSVFSSGAVDKGFQGSLGAVTATLKPMKWALDAVVKAWEGFWGIVDRVREILRPLTDALSEIGNSIADAFTNIDYDKAFSVLQTALIGGIFIAIRKALRGAFKGSLDIDLGSVGKMSNTLDALNGSLKSIQNNIKAGTLLKIALAVGVLSAGILVLSTIDPEKLATAMTAVAIGLGELVAAIALLGKLGAVSSLATIPLAASLILLAGAVTVLSLAVKIFSTFSWDEMLRGLVGVAGALVAVGIGVKGIPPSILLIGPGLIAVAVALNVMAVAMKIFATLSLGEMGKGLIGIAGALTAVGVAIKLIGPSVLLVGPGLIAVAFALSLLAGTVLLFGKMNLETMAKGIGGIAASLITLGLALSFIPPTVALQAAGLVLLSVALGGLAAAIAFVGGLEISTIAKGIGGIGLALAVLAAGLSLMSGTILGTVALFGAASALAVLVPVLGILGTMKWSTIVKGLVSIAAILGVLAVVGMAAAPGIFVLGVALLSLAAAVTLAGAGVYLLTAGLSKLGGDGSKAMAALIVSFTAFIALLPKIIIDFLDGLLGIIEHMAKLAPKVVDSMVTIVESLVDVIIKVAPKIALAVAGLIYIFVKTLVEKGPDIVSAGFDLLVNFLSGIGNNIGKVVAQVGEIIFHFLAAMVSAIPKIIAMGATVLLKFLGGITANLGKVIESAAEMIAKFLQGVTENLPKIIKAAAELVAKFVSGIASNIGNVIEAGADLIVKFLKGIGENVGKVAREAVEMVGRFVDAAVRAALDLIDVGARAVINFINGVASAIREQSPALGRAGANLGTAIVQGAITGMASMAGELVRQALSLFGKLPGAVKKFLKIDSPSKVFMEIGRNVIEGMIVGVDGEAPGVIRALEDTADTMISTMQRSLSAVPDILDGLMDMEPVITPVMDLSKIQEGAQKIADLTNVVPITAAASYDHASTISAAQEAAAQVEIDATAPETVREIKFEQNNYSPEKLSEIEIYRQTRNQLSQAANVIEAKK